MAAKGSVKKAKSAVQSDTNIKAMTMGNGWSTRAMRNGSGSRSGGGSKATRMFKAAPAEGWVSGKNC